MDICNRCGSREVVWARTEKGHPMLVDRGSVPGGNVVLIPHPQTGTYTAHVLKKGEDPVGRPTTTAHAAYCGSKRPASLLHGEPVPEPEQVPLFADVVGITPMPHSVREAIDHLRHRSVDDDQERGTVAP